MFTTAGSVRFTICAKEFEDGTAFGMDSGDAGLTKTVRAAPALSETTVPIRMPIASVTVSRSAPRNFPLLVQVFGPPLCISIAPCTTAPFAGGTPHYTISDSAS